MNAQNKTSHSESKEETHNEKQINKRQIIVDPEAVPGLSNHYSSISKAVEAAVPGTIIKVTSGNYQEAVKIGIPDLILEPREKGGEVTIICETEPWLQISMKNDSDEFTCNNICFFAYSANKQADNPNTNNDEETKVMNYEQEANEKCIEEFDIQENTSSVILLNKGVLNISECKVSFRWNKSKYRRKSTLLNWTQ